MKHLLFMNLGLLELLAVFLSIGFFLLIFLALRGFFLWYCKINVMLEKQDRLIALLAKMVERNADGPARPHAGDQN